LIANKIIQKVYWFKEKRKGNIFIETSTLLNQLKYNIQIVKQSDGLNYTIQNIDFQSVTNLNYILNSLNQTVLDTQFQNGYLEFASEKYLLVSNNSKTVITPDYTKSKLSDYAFRITVSSGNGITINDELFKKNAILLFPDFIPELQTPEFKKRLKLFLSICLPTNIKCECLFVSLQELETLLPNYSNWHDSMRFKNTQDLFNKQENDLETANPEISSVNLIYSLTSILGTKNGRNK
jgi:hypothetical protein